MKAPKRILKKRLAKMGALTFALLSAGEAEALNHVDDFDYFQTFVFPVNPEAKQLYMELKSVEHYIDNYGFYRQCEKAERDNQPYFINQ